MAGETRLVVVTGPPGIGKSTLCSAFATDAAAAGARVGRGCSSELGGAPPFWPWTQALEGIEESHLEVAREALERQELEPDESRRFAQFDTVRRAFARVARSTPLVLFLDDVHVADLPTLLLARFLLRHLGRARVLLLLASRDAPADATSADHARLLAELAAGNAVSLNGLPDADVAELVRRVAGAVPDSELVAAVVARTAGNPFFISELAAAAVQLGGIGRLVGVALPRGVRDIVGAQLARLPAAQAAILRVAAVIDRSPPTRLVAEVAGVPEVDVLDAAAAGASVRLVEPGGGLRFAHAIVGETLAGELEPARKLAIHAILAERGGAPAFLAHHALAAAPLGSHHRERAIRLVEAAGDEAMHALAWEEAARQYAAMVELSPDDPRLLVSLGEALAASGHLASGLLGL